MSEKSQSPNKTNPKSNSKLQSPSKPVTYNGWIVGDKAMRKGELCTITAIHFEMDPPSVTVKMENNGNEVGTEFSYLVKCEVCCHLCFNDTHIRDSSYLIWHAIIFNFY